MGQLIGGMIESERRQGTREVESEYTGLEGKTFAVVVAADRVIQADFPEVIGKVTQDISERLAQEVGASGYVPGQAVLEFQYNNPRWVTMTLGQVANELGVERIVYVDLVEYRLNDPGNAYLWEGSAQGMVGVIEADSNAPDEFAFQKQLRVKFPDDQGLSPSDVPRAAVNTALVKRFIDRATWLFYDHEEKYYADY
ncbi:MAG: hypothetical protein ACKVS8_08445 [Phycisphaerales bacterium]